MYLLNIYINMYVYIYIFYTCSHKFSIIILNSQLLFEFRKYSNINGKSNVLKTFQLNCNSSLELC